MIKLVRKGGSYGFYLDDLNNAVDIDGDFCISSSTGAQARQALRSLRLHR
jgi:hypothetical protein